METTLSDFELRASTISGAGIGVFAVRDIPSDTYLAFKPKNTTIGKIRHSSEIPEQYLSYCIAQDNDTYLCPADFENMELLWYLNHSNEPNAEQRSDGYYAIKDIVAGEEILIDYNQFNEPEDKKEDFYGEAKDL